MNNEIKKALEVFEYGGISLSEFYSIIETAKGLSSKERESLLLKADNKDKEIYGFGKRGEKLIYPARATDWCKLVFEAKKNTYAELALKETVKVLEALDQGKTMEDLSEVVEDVNSLEYCFYQITAFSKRGPEFGRWMIEKYDEPFENWNDWVKKIEKENEILAKNEIERKIETIKPTATISTETTAEPVPTKDNKKED